MDLITDQNERRDQIEKITERGQPRPADWPKNFPSIKFKSSDIEVPKSEWKWRKMAVVSDLRPTDAGTT